MYPVYTRSYPYSMGGGTTAAELWGGVTPAPTEVPVSGSTEETKSRLRQVLVKTAETALDYIQQRVRPGGPEGLSKDELARGAYIERDIYGRPVVRYPGQVGSMTPGTLALIAGGVILLLVLAKR